MAAEGATVESKVVATAADAVRDVEPGMAVMVGGFAVIHGWPNTLLQALSGHGAGELTIIANTLGFGRYSPQVLAERELIRRFIGSFGSFLGRKTASEDQMLAGKLEVELVPQGTFVERIRAGGAGIAAFYTPTGVATIADTAEKEKRVFNGRPHLLESALRADFALLRATRADELGNLTVSGVGQNFNVAMATAADTVVAEVEEIVPSGSLAPEAIHVPGIYVDRVVREEIPREEVMAEVFALGRDPTRGDRAPREIAGLPRDLMALRVARIIAGAGYRSVNLGIGLPTLVGGWLDEVGAPALLHAENGLYGYVSVDDLNAWDPNYYNAGGQPVAPVAGAAAFDSTVAFAMARGGHLDAIVLGAFQVSAAGDLANWRLPGAGIGGIGGAMDLIAGRVPVIVLMEHTTSSGEPRLVSRCSYPLTGAGCVSTIVTNLALIDVTPDGLVLREIAPGVTPADVRGATGCPIEIPPEPPLMELT